MSATTLQILEGEPAARPEVAIFAPGPDATDSTPAWQRIESWIAWRWGERPCSFIVEGGCGSWRAPLVPFVVDTVEAWSGEAWAPVTLAPAALGGFELGSAPFYRFAGTLGSSEDPPAAVREAVERLMRYFASIHAPQAIGASHVEERNGEESYTLDRSPTWAARAIINSGAGDLLRPWRRAP